MWVPLSQPGQGSGEKRERGGILSRTLKGRLSSHQDSWSLKHSIMDNSQTIRCLYPGCSTGYGVKGKLHNIF